MRQTATTICRGLSHPTRSFSRRALLPDGRIQGRWTQKWPSKISCGLGSQRPRKRPNSKFPNLRPNFNNNWQKLGQKFFNALFPVIWGVAGLRPNFFSSGRIFLAELAQESLRDLAAVQKREGPRQWPHAPLPYDALKVGSCSTFYTAPAVL